MKLQETLLKSLFTNKQIKTLQETFNEESDFYMERLQDDPFVYDFTEETIKDLYKSYLDKNGLLEFNDINNKYHIEKIYDLTKCYFI